MKMRTILITLTLGSLVAAGSFLVHTFASNKPEVSQPSQQKQPPVVEVMTASQTTLSLGLELTGSVEPYRVVRLASSAEGPVLKTSVREGDRVRTGDALVSIGRRKGVDALINSLREELKKEQDNLSRIQQLVESEALPGEQLDQARAAYERVRAQLVKAEETAQDYAIKAPWEGVVSHLFVKDGQFVAPRESLVEMYDPASLVIRASVPERHAAGITISMPVEVRLDAYPGATVEGRIERTYPYLDPRLRTRTMEIVLDEPVDLIPGMFARLKVLLKTIDEAVAVPVEAVVMTPKGQAVFVVEDGMAVRRPVETGIEEGNRIQITTGIRPGEKVVIAGNAKLKDGMVVRLAGAGKQGSLKGRNSGGQSLQRKVKNGDVQQ